MKMKMILPTLALCFGSALALPALADATAGAVAGASAGAAASNSFGNSIGGASIAGAYCVDSSVVGPIGLSKTMRPCVAAQIAETGGRMGTLTPGEVRAIQLEALDRIGFGLRDADDSATVSKKDWSTKSSKSTGGENTVVNYKAEKFGHLSKAQRSEVCSGAAKYNGNFVTC